MSRKRPLFSVIAFVLCIGSLAAGEMRLAQIFQDNMVLQRDAPVPVWGWADPGTTVEVAFAGQKVGTEADTAGYWKVVFEPLAVSNEGRPLEVRIGDATIRRKNVVVSEVWLAAGQSNMNHSGPDQPTGLYPHHVSSTEAGGPEVRITRFGNSASLEPHRLQRFW